MLSRRCPLAPLPQSAAGWGASVGLIFPAGVFAVLGGYPGRLLAAGLIAFLFGLAYAMAEEHRHVRQ